MSDDLTKRRPQDATKINVHEKWELEYWTKRFGVSAEVLKAAVGAVGVNVSAVEARLKQKKR